jgi:hypothetical protein
MSETSSLPLSSYLPDSFTLASHIKAHMHALLILQIILEKLYMCFKIFQRTQNSKYLKRELSFF